MSEAVLQLGRIEKAYLRGTPAEVAVLQGLDLTVSRGEVVALVAPSGAGKSTLLHIAGLLDTPDAGTVAIGGRQMAGLSDRIRTETRRTEIGFIYQFHHLLPEFSAAENIVLPQLANGVARAMLDGVRELGLSWTEAARRFAARVTLCRDTMPDLPAMSEGALLGTLATWLLPFLGGVRTAQDWKRFDMLDALRARLTWEQMQALDRAAPAHFITPLGRKIPIDYGTDPPEITLRLQEMFGQTAHPMVAGQSLRVTLLSPGQKPVQTTTDIPGFWATSYADVRKDMRGRYPRHPWPEDPTEADPTLRAKPRNTR